ncbi:uncharacterized protein MONBRDRAFT_38051 [Monosiga brevicollis MX1]|uniref:adenine phosphoribosyltransferase n=1 Tax=Monosiga brevicollis TaxID=81824 RepID=A9V5E6_MONBE|nr:uncharacterized protein MONBRDRAFT_38051 [Monosiga brevicollis MX1]EDQ87269.1 predicted protein [Monosiga brevicollis MX1]|eukprot:XP_001747882.1 hypothetical protein [Monosiga brevicollis MX1]
MAETTAPAADAGLDYVKSLITSHENFPIPGVLFQDAFPIFRDPVAMDIVLNRMLGLITRTSPKIDAIVGLDARGFLLGPLLSTHLHCSFVPIRKQGKLPGKCESVTYEKEYGTDVFEIQMDALKPGDKVVFVDDLIATGGTLRAATELVRKVGAEPLLATCIVGLPALEGATKVGIPVHALVPLPSGC